MTGEQKMPAREESRFERLAEEPPIGMLPNGKLNIVGSFETDRGVDFVMMDHPTSLVENVDTNVLALLGISGLGHAGALPSLGTIDGERLIETIHRTVAGNYLRSGASANRNRSKQNWRWQKLNTYISDHHTGKEVRTERAIAKACHRLRSEDWANQVPVSSGLVKGSPDKTRAIDLVHKVRDGHFELIELKIESDTPLFAAIEITIYACVWLVARRDKPSPSSALLDAKRIDLRVLAPAAYYSSCDVDVLEAALDLGLRALANREGVEMSFAFKRLDNRITADAIPDDQTLLNCLEASLR